MSSDHLFTNQETGEQYRGSGLWHPTEGHHGDNWNDVGRLDSVCSGGWQGLVLHKLGSLNRYRAVDTSHPSGTHYCELTYVYTPT